MLLLRKSIILSFIVVGFAQNSSAQNREFAQSVIDSLASPYFFGRGYLQEGDSKAAAFIREEFSKAGLTPFAGNYYHKFKMNVNTFPSEPNISSNNLGLKAGKDFIVYPSSSSINQNFTKIIWADEAYLNKKRNYKKLLRRKFADCLLVLDTAGPNDVIKTRRNEVRAKYKGEAVLEIVPKLTWSVARSVEPRKGAHVLPGKINRNSASVQLNIQNNFKTGYSTQNVAGFFKGSEQPDSFIVLCGHYDHLGGMGKDVYFPGANDNASGIAMLLDMVNYYKTHPPKYSVAFIGFAAEEAGLVGSFHWVNEAENLLPLGQIKFLINMDLMGSGDEGIMAVNGAVFTTAYDSLVAINKRNDFLPEVKARGKAANSDHYFFTEKGVPSFFFYLMGKYQHYHDIEDNAKNLRLTEFYDRAFKLIVTFTESIMEE